MKRNVITIALCALLLTGFACSNQFLPAEPVISSSFIFGDMVGGY